MIPIGRKLYIRETRRSKLDPSEKSDQSLPVTQFILKLAHIIR